MQSKRRARHVMFAIAAVAALSLVSAGKALALEGPGRALIPSQILQANVNALVAGDAGERVQRAFIPPYSGTVRVRWEVRSGDGTLVFTQAAVDHLAFCSKTTINTTFTSKGCDIRVAAGMPLYVFASPDSATNSASLRNVRVYYKVTDSDGKMIVYNDLPLIEAAQPRDQSR